VSALINQGYKRAEPKSAVDSLDAAAAAEGVETIIRRSLVVLSKQA
jgi:Holliday junction resolvasome RuvABC DNA-binding subunit